MPACLVLFDGLKRAYEAQAEADDDTSSEEEEDDEEDGMWQCTKLSTKWNLIVVRVISDDVCGMECRFSYEYMRLFNFISAMPSASVAI